MWTRNWTIGLEAMFVDLGTSTVDATENSTGAVFTDGFKRTKFHNTAVIGRVKVNYKF